MAVTISGLLGMVYLFCSASYTWAKWSCLKILRAVYIFREECFHMGLSQRRHWFLQSPWRFFVRTAWLILEGCCTRSLLAPLWSLVNTFESKNNEGRGSYYAALFDLLFIYGAYASTQGWTFSRILVRLLFYGGLGGGVTFLYMWVTIFWLLLMSMPRLYGWWLFWGCLSVPGAKYCSCLDTLLEYHTSFRTMWKVCNCLKLQ